MPILLKEANYKRVWHWLLMLIQAHEERRQKIIDSPHQTIRRRAEATCSRVLFCLHRWTLSGASDRTAEGIADHALQAVIQLKSSID
jgi:hypothetical protein